ncbi:MAG: hypothetical protein M3Q49_00065 [Actinomycetota bacterium]|nr:hypothetical protein [Actinomycetota bacterium]
MSTHALTHNFRYFFGNLNPSPTFEGRASEHYASVKALIEDRSGPARELSPTCFLQGSYKNETATYTINDVDIVALCEYLWDPGSPGPGVRYYYRDEIFDLIAAPLLNTTRYRNKVRYDSQSMCIKVDVEPKIEILPVVHKMPNKDFSKEPFRLYRPETGRWEDGFARYHKALLSWKNREENTGNNFVPTIKVLKHLRTKFSLAAVSFHLECLLFSLPNSLFSGGPADYIPAVLKYIASISAASWYGRVVKTPCEDRDIFVPSEWDRASWEMFHKACETWALVASAANQSTDRDAAVKYWQVLLGEDSFPKDVAR